MTILQSLAGYYGRLDGVAPPGWSPEKFGWCIVLDRAGQVVDLDDLRDVTGRTPQVRMYPVPASFPRPGTTPRAFFLWDKTAFALGVAKDPSGGGRIATPRQHAAFVALHRERLAGQDDDGLLALLRFLERWTPDQFDAHPFDPGMLDANIMFRLDGDPEYLHQRPAARALVTACSVGNSDGGAACLVSGETGPVARLHPTIKGVEGAQSSGAALVSFNLDAFTSLGKTQGDNAPTSVDAAFRYGTALNHMLTRGSGNRLRRPIGDATVIFWADARDAKAAEAADAQFIDLMEGQEDVTDPQEAAKVRDLLVQLADGRPIAVLRPDIDADTRFHVLGLSPNAARLAVRFWLTDTFQHFAEALADHHCDLRMLPEPFRWGGAPSVGRLLVRTTALQHEFKNIPPLLAGEVMRAVLTGRRYPQTLLAAAIMRLRAGDDAGSGWHAAVIRAVLARDERLGFYRSYPDNKGGIPMQLKRDHANDGYQLGRLFAVYELAQRSALGRVGAGIRERYFAAASATPASVFPLIVRGGQNHMAKVRKEKPGWAAVIERELEEIYGHFDATLPRSLSLQKQGEFAIGYYHQRAAKLTTARGDTVTLAEQDTDTINEGDDE